MTIDEYRRALLGLTEEQRRRLAETWGGAKDSIEEIVGLFAHAQNPAQWERIAIFRLAQLGVTGLKTEDEKLADAAKDSAASAKISASAAASSARSAADSVRWSRIAAIIAFGALILSVVLERCQR